jgi:hypothetical protein
MNNPGSDEPYSDGRDQPLRLADFGFRRFPRTADFGGGVTARGGLAAD